MLHVHVTNVFLLTEKNVQVVQGAIAVLVNYVRMLHEHLAHILPLAAQAAALGPTQFKQTAKILQDGPSGVLLPELAIGLVLLQLRLPLQLVESDCIPLVGELVDHLDQLNRLAPGAHMEDEDDLAWSDVKSESCLSSCQCTSVHTHLACFDLHTFLVA